MEGLEQTLFVCREVDVYKIPPRTGAGRVVSGEWRVADRLATCRCKVVACGQRLEVRLEEVASGELFGVAPVPRGQAHVAVEQASDSSRNFVLRLEDAASGRHAFVGISFSERPQAFDFNVALSDFEKQQKREAEISRISEAADPLAAAETILPEAASLYKHQDLSLKQGETIRIEVKRKEKAEDSFLSRLGGAAAASTSGDGPAKLIPLAPPPGDATAARGCGIVPPPPAAPAAAAPARTRISANADDLLGLGSAATAPGAAPAAAAPQQTADETPQGWATFD